MNLKKTLFALMIALTIIPMPTLAKESENLEKFEVVAETTKYYKTVINNNLKENMLLNVNSSITTEVTKEEYELSTSENLTRGNGTSETNYKKLVTSILSNGNLYRYKATLTWKQFPVVRSYDSIAIGHYSNVKYNSNFNFTQTYCLTSGTCKTLTTYYPQYFTSGASATFKVPEGNLSSLSQTIFFDVTKNTNATINTQKAYGDYSHATETVSVNQAKNFIAGTAGIQFNDNTSLYYDDIAPATATWSGAW